MTVTDPADFDVGELQFRTFELEVRSGGDGRTLEVRAVPYGVIADIGGRYSERFLPGAFSKQMRSGTHSVRAVKLFESHDARLRQSQHVGRAEHLEERADGLYGAFSVFTTTRGNDALELVRAGEITGVSVGFKPTPGGSRKAADGVIERHYAHLDHVALCRASEAAYADAGVLAVRTATPRPLAAWRLDYDRHLVDVTGGP